MTMDQEGALEGADGDGELLGVAVVVLIVAVVVSRAEETLLSEWDACGHPQSLSENQEGQRSTHNNSNRQGEM